MSPLFVLLSMLPASAGEGMWRPEQAPKLAEELKALGATGVDAATLGKLDGKPLGAIVDLDVCSGAFVTPDGLIATAYHCISDALQYASNNSEDLFRDGFYAKTRGDERSGGPSLVVKVTLSTEDVGTQVLSGVRKLDGRARFAQIDGNIRDIVARCESEEGIHCEVANYGGVEYQLVRQLELTDIRLVYAPPLDVGYFGGDDDNWQWPRHSGDFAFVRAYARADNKPGAYSPDNQPYRPVQYLPVAPIGPKPGEFVMVAGYPGGTYRWSSAAEFDHAQSDEFPRDLKTAREQIALLQFLGDRDQSLAPKVAPQIFQLSNDALYWEGNLIAFKRSNLEDRKWEFEGDLAKWIAADPTRTERFGDVLDRMGGLQAEEGAVSERESVAAAMRNNSLLLDSALTLYQLAVESKKPDKDRPAGFQNRDRPEIAARLGVRDAAYDFRIDQAQLRYFLQRALTLPKGLRIAELDAWFEAQGGKGTLDQRLDDILADLYANEDLADPDRRASLMDTTPWFLAQTGNPWFKLAEALNPYYERVAQQKRIRDAAWQELRPRYTQAIREFYPEARPRYQATINSFAPGLFYDDANDTLRITIGKVDGYVPRDGLIAAAQTSVLGIPEKTLDDPYHAPPALLAAIEGKNWGPYADPKLGSVVANYVTTLDTARGSSGSPTIDAQGRFVGIIFDGNYESMAADWAFEDHVTRSIHTDVAYMLWYLDAVAGADGLLTELGITPSLPTVTATQSPTTSPSGGTLFR